MQQEIENGNFKTMKRTCTKLGRDVTLGIFFSYRY